MFVIKNNEFNLLTSFPKTQIFQRIHLFSDLFFIIPISIVHKDFHFFYVLLITNSTKSHIVPSLAKKQKNCSFF
jgi:hypothetical protein